MHNTIKAVLFDLDGVITDTARYHYQAWKQLADRCGWKFNEEINDRLRGISRRESLEIILEVNAVSLNEEEIARYLAEKNSLYQQFLTDKMSPADVLSGVDSLLRTLKKRGIPMILASASRNAPFILEKLHLVGDFAGIVDPTSVPRGKPDPGIFLEAAKMAGVHPENCLGVEDSTAGISAINEAGMLSLGVGPYSRVGAARKVVSDLSDTEGLIRWIENG